MSLVWSPGFNGVTDPDAQTYIAAVEAADGQAIEGNVAYAINDFVVGCKDDGIWDAIKASCILAGARTLSGALVPLKGTAPTNNNFVSGDYNRETGLVGNGSNKYLDSNRNNNADPQNSKHLAVYISTHATRDGITRATLAVGLSTAGASGLLTTSSTRYYRANYTSNSRTGIGDTSTTPGFWGITRQLASQVTGRYNGSNLTITDSSTTPLNGNLHVFARNTGGNYSNARLTFYSIGEAIDLEKLDTRVTLLMNHISYSLASGLPALSTMDPDAASYIGAVYRAGGTLS